MVNFDADAFEEEAICLPPFNGCKGSIVRLKIQDFMTYQDVEMFAGPHVNLIMGPNGTGKSTIVCAICLALAGKPKILGRAHALKEYIRHGCHIGRIEVELFNPKGTNYVVKRVIQETGSGASSDWFLNKQKVQQFVVENLMQTLNIQLDNLCQFLPQDRVQDFAKMDSISLLRSTEQSIGEEDLDAKHDELIKVKENISQMESSLKKQGEGLRIEQQHNQRLENEVKAFNERQKLKETIEKLEGKKLWISYMTALTDFTKLKDEAKECKVLKTQAENLLVPLTKEVEKLELQYEKDRQEMGQTKATTTLMLSSLTRQYDKDKDSVETEIIGLKSNLASHENYEQERQKKVEGMKERLSGLEREIQEIIQRGDSDEAGSKVTIAELTEKQTSLSNKIYELSAQDDSDRQDMRVRQNDIRRLESELNAMGEFRSSRLRYLERWEQDTFKAVEHFNREETQQLFKGKIHEPMILHISVNDLNYGRIAEAQLRLSDMTAFLCEDKYDLKILQEEAKKHGWRISCVHHSNNPNFRKPVASFSKDMMREYDFQKCLIDLIEAPDYYMSFACKQGFLDKILIGTDKTDNLAQAVMDNLPLQRFYTAKYAYSVSTSHYSRQKTSAITFLNDARIFTDQINANEKTGLIAKLTAAKSEVAVFESQITGRKSIINQYQNESQKAESEKKEIQNRIEYRKRTVKKIEGMKEQIRQSDAQKKDLVALKAETDQKISAAKNKQVDKLLTITDEISKLAGKWFDISVLKKQVRFLQTRITAKQEKLDNSKADVTKFSNQLKELEIKTVAAAEQAKKIKADAVAKTGLKDPPRDVQGRNATEDDIDIEIHRNIAQLGFLAETDERTIHDYEARCKKIAEMQSSREDMEKQLLAWQTEMTTKKTEWLGPLQKLMDRINTNFGKFFSSMQCVGEVTLDQGEDENEFSKYGVKIKVKFRSTEPLVELSGWKQSGGERAITTALYVLALQELTKVPFRVIDEINQGMDAKNEARFFSILCELAKGPSAPQYFLLTPKMLPSGVEYPDNVEFHIILNGPYVKVSERDAIAIGNNSRSQDESEEEENESSDANESDEAMEEDSD